MSELKAAILEHARLEYQKDRHKQIIQEKARERAARDKKIAEQEAKGMNRFNPMPEEGKTEVEKEEKPKPAAAASSEAGGWVRGGPAKVAAKEEKKVEPKNNDDGGMIRRSNKPR